MSTVKIALHKSGELLVEELSTFWFFVVAKPEFKQSTWPIRETENLIRSQQVF